MEPSDADLVLACRNGSAEAWEALVSRFQRLIYAIPRRAGLSEELAADVFQATFTKLVEQLGQIEQPDRIRAWLTTTARRETWRVGRRFAGARAATDRGGPEGEPLELPDGDRLPEEALVHLEEQHLVRTALAALDDRCRRLLTLLFYRETPPSYGAIAAELGAREGSIGPTRARCLEKLRRLLTEVGF